MSNQDSFVQAGDVLDLNNSDLLAVTLCQRDGSKQRMFLVLDLTQTILLEPDSHSLGPVWKSEGNMRTLPEIGRRGAHQPLISVSKTVIATDLIDRYLYEPVYEEYIDSGWPELEISKMSLHQSIQAPFTTRNKATLQCIGRSSVHCIVQKNVNCNAAM